jgi:excisionase family DNA binding protein
VERISKGEKRHKRIKVYPFLPRPLFEYLYRRLVVVQLEKDSNMATADQSDSYLFQLILEKLDNLQELLHKRKKPFLTIQETSEYLGVSKNTLYGYTSKGILPFYKLRNRKLYFRISDLNRFVLSPENRVGDSIETGFENKPGKTESYDFDKFILEPQKRKTKITEKGKENEGRKTQ